MSACAVELCASDDAVPGGERGGEGGVEAQLAGSSSRVNERKYSI